MKKLTTTGMLLGGAVIAAGTAMMMNDRRTRQNMLRQGRKMVSKAANALDDATNNLW